MRWGIVNFFLTVLLILSTQIATARTSQTEKKVLRLISSPDFSSHPTLSRCQNRNKYVVYLIDNFTQTVKLVPEVQTSHGEMLLKMILSGRNNIDVKVLNTPLSSGLAIAIRDLLDNKCIDAVVSSTPGSNYTYNQISSLLHYRVKVDPENILTYRKQLKELLKRIAFQGFPSTEWLNQIDVNPVKLKNDATVVAFIEALHGFKVPVFLPYGNSDSTYKGQIRTINLLSLAPNAKVYSALDQNGNRVPNFPYSPLSTGDERAIFELLECPDPDNPLIARLDINNDGYYDYTYRQAGDVTYVDDRKQTLLAPSPLSPEEFDSLKKRVGKAGGCLIKEEVVMTVPQYNELNRICWKPVDTQHHGLVWLNSQQFPSPFYFNAKCRIRGQISGTSFIPPNKVKEFLP